jgi:hypothetical protein
MSEQTTAPPPHKIQVRYLRAGLIVAIIGVIMASVWGYLNWSKPGGSNSTINGSVSSGVAGINNGPPRPPEPKPTTEPTGIFKFVAQGLSAARTDLIELKAENLSCDALAQWQARADGATRLAAANGITVVHFTISQQVGACRTITDPDLLAEMRKSLVAVLDGGIATAKERSGQ